MTMYELTCARLALKRLARLGLAMAVLTFAAMAASDADALGCLGVPDAGPTVDCGGPPPPPPPPEPGPGPGPPPRAACSDGIDNDGDSKTDYPNDPGCSDYGDPDESGGVAPPPPIPSSELNHGLEPGTFEWLDTSQTSPFYDAAGALQRCKLQRWRANFDQFGVSFLGVVTMEGTFRVCYRLYQGGIVSWSDVRGDAVSTKIPWTWKGTDPGYPYGVKIDAHTVQFHYRGTAQVCITQIGCGPEKHPYVIITFSDNNTLTRRIGVA